MTGGAAADPRTGAGGPWAPAAVPSSVGEPIGEPIGWDHPDTARYYARFQRRFGRYQEANAALIRRAALGPGLRVLDIGSGDGGTAAAALACIGRSGSIVCVEPSSAMRTLGERTLDDPRVRWMDRWPGRGDRFDRVLCGAAIWQLRDIESTLRRIFGLLEPGGCFALDMPALYLGEPDLAGGGSDPLLLELPAALAAVKESLEDPPRARAGRGEEVADAPRQTDMPSADSFQAMLSSVGFRPRRWRFVTRLTQRAYREWLKIPPTTDRLLLGLAAEERARLIDGAFEQVDPDSWRLERWIGWTAWKPER